MLVAHAGEGLIAVGMGFGTLSEIAFALKLGRRVMSLASWDVAAMKNRAVEGFGVAASAQDAVARVLGEA